MKINTHATEKRKNFHKIIDQQSSKDWFKKKKKVYN